MKIYPKLYSIYLRGTIGPGIRSISFMHCSPAAGDSLIRTAVAKLAYKIS